MRCWWWWWYLLKTEQVLQWNPIKVVLKCFITLRDFANVKTSTCEERSDCKLSGPTVSTTRNTVYSSHISKLIGTFTNYNDSSKRRRQSFQALHNPQSSSRPRQYSTRAWNVVPFGSSLSLQSFAIPSMQVPTNSHSNSGERQSNQWKANLLLRISTAIQETSPLSPKSYS